MDITKQQIRDWEPCYDDDQLEEALDRLFGDKDELSPIDILKSDRSIYQSISDIAWLLFREGVLENRLLHEIGIYAWENISRKNWDAVCPDDQRPNEAVRIKKLWLDGKATDAELSAARAAARAAAWTAAESAAWTAAESAAWTAAWTAESAAESAARAAARAAAWTAAESAAYEMLYSFLITYLEDK